MADGNDDSEPAFRPYLAAVVTVAAVAAYAVFVWLMWGRVGDGDIAWNREILLMTGVEAIAFAAVGWLFGKEVNRGQADAADDAQKDAQKKSEEAGEAKGKGQALADAVRAAGADPTIGMESTSSLVGMANQLFPPQ